MAFCCVSLFTFFSNHVLSLRPFLVTGAVVGDIRCGRRARIVGGRGASELGGSGARELGSRRTRQLGRSGARDFLE